MSSRSKRKQIVNNEKQDAAGLSRKKWKFTCPPKVFLWIKLGLTVLLPVVYFVYSPLLVVVMALYVGLFFLARMAEHAMNKSVIRKNHISIPKFDSAVALLAILIALVGGVMSATEKTQAPQFKDFAQISVDGAIGGRFQKMQQKMKWNRFWKNLENFGSLLTGNRNLFESEKKFSFSAMEPPEDFNAEFPEMPDFPDMPEGFSPPQFGSPPGGFDFNISDLPIAYVASSALSTVNTVLVFSVMGLGFISLLVIYVKKRKFERMINEVILEDKITLLSDEELATILSFGEDVEEEEEVAPNLREEGDNRT